MEGTNFSADQAPVPRGRKGPRLARRRRLHRRGEQRRGGRPHAPVAQHGPRPAARAFEIPQRAGSCGTAQRGVKDPDSGKRTRRERPSSEWTVADCPAIVDARTWGRVETLLNERAPGGGHGAGVRRKYVLSGLLICEPCSSAMIVQGAKGSHYGCATHQQGGAAACSMALLLRRDAAEHHVLEPVRAALLTSDAVDLACEQIREAVLEERLRIAECPDADLAAQVAELEALLAGNTTLAATLRPALEALRTKRAAAKRVAWRRAQAAKVASVPAEALYRVAVRALVATLEGANIEAARAAVRSLVGTVPVFEQAGVLWGRIGMSGAALLRVAGVDERAGSGGPLRAL